MAPLQDGGGSLGCGSLVGSGGRLLRKRYPAAREWALGAVVRYEASLAMWRAISLSMKRTMASGCVAQN
jgi:hypothetical protein